MPRGAGGEAVALQQHDVLPAHMREVIGDRRPDDAATDHHHPRAIRQNRLSHRWTLELAGQLASLPPGLKHYRWLHLTRCPRAGARIAAPTSVWFTRSQSLEERMGWVRRRRPSIGLAFA